MNQEIGKRQFSVFGPIGGHNSPLMHVPLWTSGSGDVVSRYFLSRALAALLFRCCGTICAILLKGIMGNISVILFWIWTSGSRCRLKIFLIYSSGSLLSSEAKSFLQFWYRALWGTFLSNYFAFGSVVQEEMPFGGLMLSRPGGPCVRRSRTNNWAATCDFKQCGILTSVVSDEPVQASVKLRNSECCSVSRLTVIQYSSDQQWLWPDCAYAQAGLSLCWSHIPHRWKSHVAAHMCNYARWPYEEYSWWTFWIWLVFQREMSFQDTSYLGLWQPSVCSAKQNHLCNIGTHSYD